MTKRMPNRFNPRGYFRDMKPVDYVLGGIGLCLGTAAALFPWHVYLNPDSYGPPRLVFSRDGVVPGGEYATRSRGRPLFVEDTEDQELVAAPAPRLDPVTTGRVDRSATVSSDLDQPFPGNGRPYNVYAISAGRVLIGDADGIYLISTNDRLPDGTILDRIARDESGWFIETSAGLTLYAR